MNICKNTVVYFCAVLSVMLTSNTMVSPISICAVPLVEMARRQQSSDQG